MVASPARQRIQSTAAADDEETVAATVHGSETETADSRRDRDF